MYENNLGTLLKAFLAHVQSVNTQEDYNDFVRVAFTLAKQLASDHSINAYLAAIDKTVCETSESLNFNRLTSGSSSAKIFRQLDCRNITQSISVEIQHANLKRKRQ